MAVRGGFVTDRKMLSRMVAPLDATQSVAAGGRVAEPAVRERPADALTALGRRYPCAEGR